MTGVPTGDPPQGPPPAPAGEVGLVGPADRLRFTIRGLAFRAARSPLGGSVVRAGFVVAPGLLPLATIERGRRVVRCRHPRPTFGSRHELIIPLVAVCDLFALGHPRLAPLRAELFDMIDAVLDTPAGSPGADPSILVNAGPRQDVRQVHFHITDQLPAAYVPTGRISWTDWDTAVRSLPAMPDVADRFERGFSLVQTSRDRRVHLI